MNNEMKKNLGVRYTKITFTIQFIEDTIMPEHKASALRGGIGEMLLRANCIRDRKCETCDFEEECIVQRTMYSKFDRKPEFITTGDSVGYVMECEDRRSEFAAGETMRFSLILFGKTIVYFNQYLQSIFALGQYGVGKHYSRFQISRITNYRGQDILSQNDVFMEKYQVSSIQEYVDYRKHQLMKNGFEGKLAFVTPMTLKYQGEFLQEFNMDAILKAIARRIYMLDCFEGYETEQMRIDDQNIPEILDHKTFFSSVSRYSNRQRMSMDFHGIKGEVVLGEVDEHILEMLLVGELIHIGKNTSFGFGKYRIV